MADPQSTRPSLQPRAQDIQTWFHGGNILNETSLSRAPDAARDLAAALGTVAGNIGVEKGIVTSQVRRFVEDNPHATENQIVEVMGGHGNIAHAVLREQESRQKSEIRGIQVYSKWVEDPSHRSGPADSRKFLDAEFETWFDDIPKGDTAAMVGAQSAYTALNEKVMTESIASETKNLHDRAKAGFAAEVRTSFIFNMDTPTTAADKIRIMKSEGKFAALDGPEMMEVVLQTASEMAQSPEFLGRGEELLLSLVDGDDPVITDPQQRLAVASSITTLRRGELTSFKLKAAEEKAAKASLGEEGENEVMRAIVNRQPIPTEGSEKMVAGFGGTEAGTKIKAMTTTWPGIATGMAESPANLLIWQTMGDRGQLDVPYIAALPISIDAKAELFKRIDPAHSILGTAEYKVEAALFNDAINPLYRTAGSTAASVAFRSMFNHEAEKLVVEDPSLLNKARGADRQVALFGIRTVLAEKYAKVSADKAAAQAGALASASALGAARAKPKSNKERIEALFEAYSEPTEESTRVPTDPDMQATFGAETPEELQADMVSEGRLVTVEQFEHSLQNESR